MGRATHQPAYAFSTIDKPPAGQHTAAMEPHCRPPVLPATISSRRAICGQGAVEFLFAAVPVLLLALGSLEAIHWYFVRQAASLALLQAGRAAVTQQADPAVLDQAFTDAIQPLYTGTSPAQSRARLERAMSQRQHELALPAWRIQIQSPSTATFHDFATDDPELRHPAGLPVIDNDYLHEQHQQRLSQGLPEGRGVLSGQTTDEANTLVLHLIWPHKPLLPGVSQLLKQLAPSDNRYASLAMARGGYLPIHREIALVMQSHAVAWEMPAHGRVVRLTAPGHLTSGQGLDVNTAADSPSGKGSCSGIWCLAPWEAGSWQSAANSQDTTFSDDVGNARSFPQHTHPDYREALAEAPLPDPARAAEPEGCPGCCG